MDADPPVPVSRVVAVFPAGSLDLWLAALDRPEADFQAQAAVTIASAHERGMPGLAAAVGPLVRALDRPGQSAAATLAVARALVTLDAREAAPSLLAHARDGAADFREVVEPALGRWAFEPARAVWRDRLALPPPYRRSTTLAMRGLATLRDEPSAAVLRDIARSPVTPAAYRLEAARALGAIRTAGSEADADRLAAEGTVPARLAAASLLSRHQGDEAVRRLQQLAQDPEPAVAAVAAARLVELDTKLVLPVLDPVLKSPGAGVRSLGVEVVFRNPSADHLRRLGDLLSDRHPDVRAKARQSLRELAATPDLRGPVIDQGTRALAGGDWRGQEQAAVLLAHLDHQPAAARLVELLAAGRGEVFAAAAFGLRVLAVPDTRPAVLGHLAARHRAVLASGPSAGLRDVPPALVDREMSQLVQLLGRTGYRPADAVLRELVPRGDPPNFVPVGAETRAAAIWALGTFHAGEPEAELVELIEGRLTGDPGFGRDHPRVRRMAAVALGRMKAVGSAGALREVADGTAPTPDVVPNACRRALADLAGDPPPVPGPFEVVQRDPFLLPAR